jgi:mannosyltransferase OCH1-like enzyme
MLLLVLLLVVESLNSADSYTSDINVDNGFYHDYLPSENTSHNVNAISKNIWIAVVNKSEALLWDHIQKEIRINPTWTVHVCDNADKDKFMNDIFVGTSLLWAYNNINPFNGGAAKADIWRYAVLYINGGVYIDADSYLSRSVDTFVKNDDTMIVTFEQNHYDGDWCYSPNSEFSTYRTSRRFPGIDDIALFHNRNLLNWCIISSPGHQFLKQTLINFVKLMRIEYLGLSALKMAKYDKFSKHVYWYVVLYAEEFLS